MTDVPASDTGDEPDPSHLTPADRRRFTLASVPELLLGVIVDGTLDRLAAAQPEDVPVALRQLVSFDRRARSSSTARRQVARTLDLDAALADASAVALLARAEVAAAARSHDPADPAAGAIAAAARDDLELHVAALWAANPANAAVALGVAVAFAHLDSVLAGLDAERESAARGEEAAREALRRAETALTAERERASRIADELRDERASRRGRDESTNARVDEQRRRADAAESAATSERARADGAVARAGETAARAERLSAELHQARAQMRSLEHRFSAAVPAADVAGIAQRVEALALDLRRLGRAASPETTPRPDAPRRDEPRPRRRPKVAVPAGRTTDDPEALDAMLRAAGVTLVVDGYNAAFVAWPDASAIHKRERLEAGLVDVVGRCRCDVVCVFDGEGDSVRRTVRNGVQILFSPAGVEADEVVIDAVRSLPFDTPVIVVSSDGWVREHAAAAGAVVVPSATLIGLIRSPRR